MGTGCRDDNRFLFYPYLLGHVEIIAYFCGVKKILLTLLLVWTYSWNAFAQQQQYRPDGRAFVCVNGHHRYTRALYGSPTPFRIETSDRPLFAVCQQEGNRYVQFQVNGVSLDATDYCEARYEDGMRSYVLRHKSWGQQASLRIKVVASLVQEQAFWRLQAEGFSKEVSLEVTVTNGQERLQHITASFDDDCYVCFDSGTMSVNPQVEDTYEAAVEAMQKLASRIEFNTPDPYVNTLGGALVVAADGDWDGKKWLQGCVGCNMSWGRWRAGYLGDVLGWPDRAVSCFNDCADELVKNVSVSPSRLIQDKLDEILWHFRYDADKDYMRKMWPVLKTIRPNGTDTYALAYRYRANMVMARIATLIGEDPKPYQREAEAVLKDMNSRLWLRDKGHWAEYQDAVGLQRVHERAAVWSIYAPIDCGACTPEQAYRATKYVDDEIPHIPPFNTIATSDWMPYSWGSNNVVPAEVMHMALAYFEAGRSEEGFRLMMANVMDQMYCGQSPANFGQISQYDVACGESCRDVGDCIGISARTLIQGLFGIQPDALQDRLVIRPGFPEAWDSASVRTPYIYYKYQRQGEEAIYEITQQFRQPLKVVLRQNLGMGKYRDVEGTSERHQVIRVKLPVPLPEVYYKDNFLSAESASSDFSDEPTFHDKFRPMKIDACLNANLTDRPDVSDSVFRSLVVKDELVLMGVPFRSFVEGHNIAFTSLGDDYPDSIAIPMTGKYNRAWLLMTGTTNHRESRMANGLVVAHYQDGTSDTLQLVNPDNWCPIDQDYYVDDHAFQTSQPRPYRVSFSTGTVSRDLGKTLRIQGVEGRKIPGGAATMLCMPLRRTKKLQSLTLHTLSNEVLIGLMAVTLQ